MAKRSLSITMIWRKLMKQTFEDLIHNLKDSIADYRYYTDFDKVYRNVNRYRVELNILNSLIGSYNIEAEFIQLLKRYPEVLNVIPLLLAVRKSELLFFDGVLLRLDFSQKSNDDQAYLRMMRESGLFEMMERARIKSFEDYLTGVEVGLDSNARKNRTGTTMENIVESFIRDIPGIEYHRELTKDRINQIYGVDLDSYLIQSQEMNLASKRFDFVIKTIEHLYIIETNYYGSSGSKLNETARSYKSLGADLALADNVTFIWITDGAGWRSAQNNLRETYMTLEHLYTLKDLEDDKLRQIIV